MEMDEMRQKQYPPSEFIPFVPNELTVPRVEPEAAGSSPDLLGPPWPDLLGSPSEIGGPVLPPDAGECDLNSEQGDMDLDLILEQDRRDLRAALAVFARKQRATAREGEIRGHDSPRHLARTEWKDISERGDRAIESDRL